MLRDTLRELNYQLIDTDELGEVWACENQDHQFYVSLLDGNGIIQLVKSSHDPDKDSTVIHFSRTCDELTDLLRKWSDVTPATYSD
jgi:hypothetical protein